jgi:hypothetical protein
LAQTFAWLALLAGMLVIYLSFVLFDFFPLTMRGRGSRYTFLTLRG